jgi:hypothetical protein
MFVIYDTIPTFYLLKEIFSFFKNANCRPQSLEDPLGINSGKKMMISKSEGLKQGTILVN